AGPALVYSCGPERLLAAIEDGCKSRANLVAHVERFSPKEIDDSGNTEFDVILEESDMRLTVPADRSIFEVVREAGVSVLGSCLEGICGTCETGVIAGEIDHRDSVLEDDEREEGDIMMICVSRCKGKELTLEL
ncbi:2Fe-2S iron-sulfur cluster-binding protein, partial [Dermacoccus sp. UBA1591]